MALATRGIRQKKKDTVRDRLIEVSTALFLAKGFDNVTVADIAARAGISARSFFRYFPTKEALVFHDQPRRRNAIRLILTAGGDAISPFERIKNCMALMAVDYPEHRDALLAEYAIVRKSPYLQAINLATDAADERHFEQCLRTFRGRTFLTRRQATMVGAAIFAALRVLVWEWVGKGATTSTRASLNDGMNFVDGLAMAYCPDVVRPAADDRRSDAMAN